MRFVSPAHSPGCSSGTLPRTIVVNFMTVQNFSKPAARPRIVIPESEHTRLTNLAEKAMERDSPVGEYLADELSRAQIVPDENCAPHLVRMGSLVTYSDDASGRTRTVTIVYPKDANIDENRISVLTPIGAALIGMSPGQSIQWPTPDGGTASLTVLDVNNEGVGAQ
jgi:regulator of nucleoside diphosphate kinase